MDRVLILLAAGKGRRAGVEKQWHEVEGLPVVAHTLVLCQREKLVSGILLGVAQERLQLAEETLKSYAPTLKTGAFVGGEERRDTVWRGLQLLGEETEIVVIHDAARPFASKGLFQRVIQKAIETGAAVPAIPVRDTIKEVQNHQVKKTLERQRLRAIQTPQAFRREVILKGYQMALKKNLSVTDDASAVELTGHPVAVVEGEMQNEKLTFKEDMLRWSPVPPRVGWGIDVHTLVEGQTLILCGVEVPHQKGLQGHSDADVALHALCDAMLGAAGLGDIGRHFPDTDERYRGMNSSWFVEQVVEMLGNKGLRVANADITIMAQGPRLSPYAEKMRKRVAEMLKITPGMVNVKATTTEGLGFVGRKEGIAASAVVTLVEKRI